MNKKKYKVKNYKHIDKKINIDKAQNKIKDPVWVAQHGFYPFIHFEMIFNKYDGSTIKPKQRKIFYASHMDSFIYKYYGDMLNDRYTDVVKRLGINEVATAYRNNLKGKSNINFSKEVIKFIKKQEKAYIIIADFTDFFDRLNHKYLKEKIKVVINSNTLPSDYYNVFKNITKYSYIIREEIEEELRKKYSKREILNKRQYFSSSEFRDFKYKKIYKNTKSYGIPQGAGISSVLSNIYMLEFDQKLNSYAKVRGGIYRRYSDDLILVIPEKEDLSEEKFVIHRKYLEEVKEDIEGLKLQEEKTQMYVYSDDVIKNRDNEPTILNYLGFSFDGDIVKIREKTLFKFYNKAYRRVRICNRATKKYNQKLYRKSLYRQYTHLGKNKKGHGNFLSYVSRAQNIFDDDTLTVNLMENQVKNHWSKIQKRLIDP